MATERKSHMHESNTRRNAGHTSSVAHASAELGRRVIQAFSHIHWLAYVGAVFNVALAAAVSWFLSRLLIEPANLVMVFLLAVTTTAIRHGAGPSALASLLGVAVLDFFFVEPHLTFAVRDTQYLLTFAVMAGVGLLISHLTARVRDQGQLAHDRERRTAELYSLSRRLTRTASVDEVARHAARHIAETLDLKVAIFLTDSAGRLALRTTAAATATEAWGESEAAQSIIDCASGAAEDASTLAESAAMHVPLLVGRGPVGVLIVRRDPSNPAIGPAEREHIEAIANHVALAIERAKLVEVAQNAAVDAESERLRSGLLASISHDLRTPLATIAGSAGALLEPGCDDATRIELSESIRDHASRLSGYLEKLLAMTRLEAGRVQVHREWQPIEDVIGSALARVEHELGDREVHLDVPANLPLAPIDASLIEQVLVNLLENACRYAGAGAAIELRACGDDQDLLVEVADDGVGLQAGTEERVFEKFYRASKDGTGAGLGLAICSAIVAAHGGTMSAANRPGGGAAFSFILPLEGRPPELPGAEPAEQAR